MEELFLLQFLQYFMQIDDDSTSWSFKHTITGKKGSEKINSTSYVLILKDKENKESEFSVHIIKLGGHYFLDFYLEDFFGKQEPDLASFHIIPVHTFAKICDKICRSERSF